MGPAGHGTSSLLSPEGFFLGKMGFREAVAAGQVALSQVRGHGLKGVVALTSELNPEDPGKGCHQGQAGARHWSSHMVAQVRRSPL